MNKFIQHSSIIIQYVFVSYILITYNIDQISVRNIHRLHTNASRFCTPSRWGVGAQSCSLSLTCPGSSGGPSVSKREISSLREYKAMLWRTQHALIIFGILSISVSMYFNLLNLPFNKAKRIFYYNPSLWQFPVETYQSCRKIDSLFEWHH